MHRPTHFMQRSPVLSHLMVALLALLISFAGTAQGATRNEKADKYYEDGLTRYERNDMRGAIIQLKNALQQDPNMLTAHVLLGRAYLDSGQAANAEHEFERSLQLGADRSEIVLSLAKAYADQGKSKRLLEAILPDGLPPSVRQEVLQLRAYAQMELGDLRGAQQTLERANVSGTKPAGLLLAEANLALREGKRDTARDLVNQALKLTPNDPMCWNFRATIYHSEGNVQATLADYGKALALKPRYLDARLSRAALLLDLNRQEQAKQDLDYLLKEYPQDPRAAYLRAVLAAKRNDSAGAREALQMVVKTTDALPTEALNQWPQYLLLAGLAHYSLNEPEKAKSYLQRMLSIAPGHTGARKLLGSILLSEGDSISAIEVITPAVKAEPNDAYGLSLLANAYMARKNYRKASELLERAVEVAGGAPQFQSSLGFSLLGGKQESLGIEQLTQAFRKDPGQSKTGMALAILHIKRGQPQRAVEIAEAMVRSDANNTAALNLLGVSRVAAGDRKGGRTAYEKALKLDASFMPAQLNLAKLDSLEGKHDAARNRLTSILKSQPSNTQAIYELARLENGLGHLDIAASQLEKLHALDKNAIGPGLLLADIYLRRNQAEKSLELAKDLEAVSPQDLGVLAALGRAHVAAGRPAIASVIFERMTRLAGSDSAWLYRIAQLQLEAGNQKLAVYNLENALMGKADDLASLTLLSELELKAGKLDDAERRAQFIVARHPGKAAGYRVLASIAMARGRHDEAIARYRTAFDKEPGRDSAIQLYWAQLQTGRQAQATAFMTDWIKAHPGDDVAMKALAEGHLHGGNLAASRSLYESVLKHRPDDVGILNNLANILLKQNDAAALGYAEKAYKLAPTDAAVADTLGWVLVQQGQFDKGLRYLRDAKLRDSGNPDIRYHLAVALERLGRTAEAKQELERALASKENFEGLQEARKLQARLSSQPVR